MSELYKLKRDVALIAIVNNMIYLVYDEPMEKRDVKRGRDRKWMKDRDEKVYINILF